MGLKRKELNKRIVAVLKEERKKYGYRSRMDVLYKKRGDFFTTILIHGTEGTKIYGTEGKNTIKARVSIKPYFMDDIFWKIFHMAENSNEPMSLRAVGAFSLWGLIIYEESEDIHAYEEVEAIVKRQLKICEEKLSEFLETIREDIEKFLEYADSLDNTGLYNKKLGRMLFDIKEGRYVEPQESAVIELGNYRSGNFVNEGKDIYEHIVIYCEEKLYEKGV